MKKSYSLKDPNVPLVVFYISILFILLGGIALIQSFFFEPNYCDNHFCKNDIIALLLFTVGTILLLGVEVIFKFKKRMLKELLSENNEFIDIVQVHFSDLNEIEHNEEENIKNAETENTTTFDTVIVPASKSIEQIKNTHEYICPANRKFREDLDFIAFYVDKMIVGYGRIMDNKPVPNDKQELVFTLEFFNKLSIPHNDKFAFVQNKRYCNFKDLQSAKSTDSLKYEQ